MNNEYRICGRIITACCLLLTIFSRETIQAKTPLPEKHCLSLAVATTTVSGSITNAVTNPTRTPALVAITGKVTSMEGETLAGVSVVIKGTSTGTATDANGAYTVNADAGATLVFSFIGFTTEEVLIGNRTTIDVTLVPDIETLSEVVVTALGIKREAKTLGYATATVAPEQITTNRTANFMNALQGKIPGVNITSLGTGPAGTSKVRIRGQTSFSGQNNPLIVLNGVPIDNTNFSVNPGNLGSDGSNANRGAFNNSDGGDGL